MDALVLLIPLLPPSYIKGEALLGQVTRTLPFAGPPLYLLHFPLMRLIADNSGFGAARAT